MLIIGSKALTYHYPSLDRDVKDIDLIGYKSDIQYLINTLNPSKIKEGSGIISLIGIQNKSDFYSTDNVEILLADESESLQAYLAFDSGERWLKWASLEVLLSLKKSHIHFPIKFNKHISDYTFLNEKLGGDYLDSITKSRYRETEERLGKLKTPSLNKPITEFFGQSKGFVKSYFIHDDIHKAVAHYDKPLYLNMQRDITIAKCEKDMWDRFSFEDKCKCVLEEAYVIALERKVLPGIFGKSNWVSSNEALEWALMRICTNLCSGWFRQFATDNFFKIKEFINSNYAVSFLEKYNNNQICRKLEE